MQPHVITVYVDDIQMHTWLKFTMSLFSLQLLVQNFPLLRERGAGPRLSTLVS